MAVVGRAAMGEELSVEVEQRTGQRALLREAKKANFCTRPTEHDLWRRRPWQVLMGAVSSAASG